MGGAGRHCFGEAEGVGDLEVGVEVDGAVVGDLVGGEGDVPAVGRIGDVLGELVGHEPGAGVVDEPDQLGGVSLFAHHAVCSSTNAAASGVRATVAWAIARARHGVTRPARTPAHSWGRR